MPLLRPITIPGLFVTGTDTAVGKTVCAAAIAWSLRRRRVRVGVCKLVATGCEKRREGLVSDDAELLAHWGDARHPLDLICPQRFAAPLAPAIAAQRAGMAVDYSSIQRSLDLIAGDAEVMIIEGAGGVMTPMDDQHTLVDVIRCLGLPAVIVARAGLGTINHTLLTLSALREADIRVSGVIVNRYPTDLASEAEETNPRAIERWGKTRVLCLAPDEPFTPPAISPAILEAIDTVDWQTQLGRKGG